MSKRVSAPSLNSKDVEKHNEEIRLHYNAIKTGGKEGRQSSSIYNLRKFNNWAKTVLIGKGVYKLPSKDRDDLRVLDIAMGKGGDLQKWARYNPSIYVGCDIADLSVKEAQDRWASMNPKAKFRIKDAHFLTNDCFDGLLNERVQEWSPFNITSCQFAMHYAFSSRLRALNYLKSVSSSLNKGGIYLCTTTNASYLLDRLEKSEDLTFGNKYYKVQFDRPIDNRVKYGISYTFSLEGAVESLREFLVKKDVLEDLALTAGLKMIFYQPFMKLYKTESNNNRGMNLIKTMKIDIDKMSKEEQEVANCYVAILFKKI